MTTADGARIAYDLLVQFATGSAPFVPPVPGIEQKGLFVYRTIEDLDAILAYSEGARRAAVIGGGLLGLEAARAVLDRGLETHVVEVAPRLMPRQLDGVASALLERTIRELGVHVHVDRRIVRIRGEGVVEGIEFSDGEVLDADLVVVSAGIRPRDELARAAGLAVGERGGVVVDDRLRTSDERVFAVGEVALHRDTIYGLVAPGYEMADALARNLTGGDTVFAGADSSAKLKLLGTDVATFGDPFQDPARTRVVCVEDQIRGTYKKLVFRSDSRTLLGGILVGDAASYATLLHWTRSKGILSETLEEIGLAGGGGSVASGALPDDAQVCSCNNVPAKTIRLRIRDDGLASVAEVKACTKAGTGCGGCLPMVGDILQAELKASGRAVKQTLCEHFAFTRQELFQIVATRRIRTFTDLIAGHGTGSGCEICKPAVASILASVHNESILEPQHRTLQDTNDRFLANLQKNGTYSVVPRVPARREITPDQLIALRAGRVAEKYGLYVEDHRRRNASRPSRCARRTASGHLGGAHCRRFRERARLRQGTAHRKELCRNELVPFRCAGLDGLRHSHRGAIQGRAFPPQVEGRGERMRARMRRGSGQGLRSHRHGEGMETSTCAETAGRRRATRTCSCPTSMRTRPSATSIVS